MGLPPTPTVYRILHDELKHSLAAVLAVLVYQIVACCYGKGSALPLKQRTMLS